MANGISLEDIRQALSASGDPWEAGFTSLTSLSSEERKAYLGVTPPPGELSIEEVAARALQLQQQVQAEAMMAIGAPRGLRLAKRRRPQLRDADQEPGQLRFLRRLRRRGHGGNDVARPAR